MWPPWPGRDGTDGRCFASDGRCHLPSGHASSPLERQQSRRAHGVRGPQGGSPPSQLHRGGKELPGSQKTGGSPHPVWFCRGEDPAALGCFQCPPCSTGSLQTLQNPRILQGLQDARMPRSQDLGEFANTAPKSVILPWHPSNHDRGCWWLSWPRNEGQTGGARPCSSAIYTLLQPSCLKMVGKWGKQCRVFSRSCEGRIFHAGLCGAAAPGSAGSSSGCPGPVGRDQTWD